MFQGVEDSLGPSATLVVGGVEVVVSSERRQCLDREMLRVVGIELSNFRLLVIKSAVHFRADFDSDFLLHVSFLMSVYFLKYPETMGLIRFIEATFV